MILFVNHKQVNITLDDIGQLKVNGLPDLIKKEADQTLQDLKRYKPDIIKAIKAGGESIPPLQTQSIKAGFNPSLKDAEIIRYQGDGFKCRSCGGDTFLILADGSRSCFYCWEPESEEVYKKRCEKIPLMGYSYTVPKPAITPPENKYFLSGVEPYHITNRKNQQVECRHCDGVLFTRAYNFLNVCFYCGSLLDG